MVHQALLSIKRSRKHGDVFHKMTHSFSFNSSLFHPTCIRTDMCMCSWHGNHHKMIYEWEFSIVKLERQHSLFLLQERWFKVVASFMCSKSQPAAFFDCTSSKNVFCPNSVTVLQQTCCYPPFCPVDGGLLLLKTALKWAVCENTSDPLQTNTLNFWEQAQFTKLLCFFLLCLCVRNIFIFTFRAA